MPSRSKLLILTPTAALRGGVEKIIESLAIGLPAHGIDVVVGLARGALHDTARYRAEYPKLKTIDFESRTDTRAGRVQAVSDAIKSVAPTSVLNARIYDAYEAASRLKLAGGTFRLLTTIQASEGDYLLDLEEWEGFVDGCVTSGVLLARGAQKFSRFPAQRVVSIAGGVRLPSHTRTLRVDDGPLRIGYVGRLDEPQKRISDLLRLGDLMHQRNERFNLTVVGSGPAENSLRSELNQRPWNTSVQFLGWCTAEELYESIFPTLDVLVHFAAFEGVTIAPREAMAHGVVPVISRFPGLRTEGMFLDGANALTFEVGDIDAAADAIARLGSDAELFAKLSERAKGSQGGELSDAGAIAKWATFIHAIEALPIRKQEDLPPLANPSHGRLDVLPTGIAEALRRLRGKRGSSQSPGAEWPHSGGDGTLEKVAEIERQLLELEAEI